MSMEPIASSDFLQQYRKKLKDGMIPIEYKVHCVVPASHICLCVTVLQDDLPLHSALPA